MYQLSKVKLVKCVLFYRRSTVSLLFVYPVIFVRNNNMQTSVTRRYSVHRDTGAALRYLRDLGSSRDKSSWRPLSIVWRVGARHLSKWRLHILLNTCLIRNDALGGDDASVWGERKKKRKERTRLRIVTSLQTGIAVVMERLVHSCGTRGCHAADD